MKNNRTFFIAAWLVVLFFIGTDLSAKTYYADVTFSGSSKNRTLNIKAGSKVKFSIGVKSYLKKKKKKRVFEWYVNDQIEDAETRCRWGCSRWSYGDLDLSVKFYSSGSHTVKVLVYDEDYDYTRRYIKWTIKVEDDNKAPTIRRGSPSSSRETINVDEKLRFKAYGDDRDGNIKYMYLYQDGRQIERNKCSFGCDDDSISARIKWSSPGRKQVKAKIVDSKGLSDELTWSVTVKSVNKAPTIRRGSPSSSRETINVDEKLRFKAYGDDRDGNIKYMYIYQDGRQIERNKCSFGCDDDSISAWIKWSSPGKKQVKAKIVDSEGLSDELTWSVTVESVNKAPTIRRDSPSSSSVNLEVDEELYIKAKGKDEDRNIKYMYIYQDGRQIERNKCSFGCDDDSISARIKWSSPGRKQVKAKIVDSEGLSDELTWSVTVKNSNEKPSILRKNPPNKDISLIVNQKHSFKVVATDPDKNIDATYLYKDGALDKKDQCHFGCDSHTTSKTMSWRKPGMYTVTAKVKDTDDASNHTYWKVIVKDVNKAPSLPLFRPVSPSERSVDIKWLASSDPNGDLITYHVDLCSKSGKALYSAKTDRDYIKFSGLNPKTSYKAKIKACDDQKLCSAWKAIDFETMPSLPKSKGIQKLIDKIEYLELTEGPESTISSLKKALVKYSDQDNLESKKDELASDIDALSSQKTNKENEIIELVGKEDTIKDKIRFLDDSIEILEYQRQNIPKTINGELKPYDYAFVTQDGSEVYDLKNKKQRKYSLSEDEAYARYLSNNIILHVEYKDDPYDRLINYPAKIWVEYSVGAHKLKTAPVTANNHNDKVIHSSLMIKYVTGLISVVDDPDELRIVNLTNNIKVSHFSAEGAFSEYEPEPYGFCSQDDASVNQINGLSRLSLKSELPQSVFVADPVCWSGSQEHFLRSSRESIGNDISILSRYITEYRAPEQKEIETGLVEEMSSTFDTLIESEIVKGSKDGTEQAIADILQDYEALANPRELLRQSKQIMTGAVSFIKDPASSFDAAKQMSSELYEIVKDLPAAIEDWSPYERSYYKAYLAVFVGFEILSPGAKLKLIKHASKLRISKYPALNRGLIIVRNWKKTGIAPSSFYKNAFKRIAIKGYSFNGFKIGDKIPSDWILGNKIYRPGKRVVTINTPKASRYELINSVDGKKTFRDSFSGIEVTYDELGFPIFTSKADIYLSPKDFRGKNDEVFPKLNEILKGLDRDTLKNKIGLTDYQINQLKFSDLKKAPEGLTWHHHQDIGRFQLVPTMENNEFPHTGGKAIWVDD